MTPQIQVHVDCCVSGADQEGGNSLDSKKHAWHIERRLTIVSMLYGSYVLFHPILREMAQERKRPGALR